MCSLQSLGELGKWQIMNMPRTAPNEDTNTPAQLYLDLLKKRLVRWGEDTLVPLQETGSFSRRRTRGILKRLLAKKRLEVLRRVPFNADARENGRDWPVDAETMIGLKRLNNLQYCIEAVLHENIPGDLVETGVWRGGPASSCGQSWPHFWTRSELFGAQIRFEASRPPILTNTRRTAV